MMAWRAIISDELGAGPQENLTFSIRLIDHGFGISTIGRIVDLSSTRVGELVAARSWRFKSSLPHHSPNPVTTGLPDISRSPVHELALLTRGGSVRALCEAGECDADDRWTGATSAPRCSTQTS